MQRLQVQEIMTEADAIALEGTFARPSHVKQFINTSTCVANEQGSFLCSLQKGALLQSMQDTVKTNFAKVTRHRGSRRKIAANDKQAKIVLAGYYDRRDPHTTRIVTSSLKKRPNKLGMFVCRETVYTRDFPLEWNSLLPVLRHLDQCHASADATGYRNQKQFLKKSVLSNFCIPETIYTTLSVNYSVQTRLHRDKGDYADGSVLLSVSGDGFEGGELCFPRYGIALQVRPGDVIVMDAHQVHGNLPIQLTHEHGQRIALVAYAREGMRNCRHILPTVEMLAMPSTSHAESFAIALKAVEVFVKVKGRLPKIHEKHQSIAVGEWCHNRRRDKKDKQLPIERIEAIERIPGWVWNVETSIDTAMVRKNQIREETFQTFLTTVQQFIDKNRRLPKTKEVWNGVSLGKWLDNRRHDLRRGVLSENRKGHILAVIGAVPRE